MDPRKYRREQRIAYLKSRIKIIMMKTIIVTIERNEEAFFAYTQQIDGCTAGGFSFDEVKANIEEMIDLCVDEDMNLAKEYSKGYRLNFEIDLGSVFKLLPEVNISSLAELAGMNPGLLRQYASGAKRASEKQADKINLAISALANKLNSLRLTG
jgi:predicted RNase H-like HicB family nuclease